MCNIACLRNETSVAYFMNESNVRQPKWPYEIAHDALNTTLTRHVSQQIVSWVKKYKVADLRTISSLHIHMLDQK